MKCDGTLLLPLNLHLLFCLALAEDFTDRVVAVSDSDILVAPLAVANLTLDTSPRAAYLGPGSARIYPCLCATTRPRASVLHS